MVLIFLGLIVFIVSLFLNKQREEFIKLAKGMRFAGIAIIILGFLTSCIKQIDAGQIGVKSLFGKIDNDILTSGLNVINPLVDVKTVDVKTLNYTMSGVHDEGDKEGDDAIRVLTADGLEVIIDLTVLYRVTSDQAPRLIRETGLDYRDKIVRPLTRKHFCVSAIRLLCAILLPRK